MLMPTIAAAQSAFHNVFIVLTPGVSFPLSLKTCGRLVFTLRGEGSSLTASTQFLKSAMTELTPNHANGSGGSLLGSGLVPVLIELRAPDTCREICSHHARKRALDGSKTVLAARGKRPSSTSPKAGTWLRLRQERACPAIFQW